MMVRNWGINPPDFKVLGQGMLTLTGYFLVSRFYRIFFFEEYRDYAGTDGYFSSWILGGSVEHLFFVYLILVVLVLAGLAGVILSWKDFDSSRTRLFILGLTLVLVWFGATKEVNYFFNSAHAIDRLILVTSGGLVWFHPMFLFPFLAEYFLLASQYDFLVGYSLFPVWLLLDCLMVFMSHCLARIITGKNERSVFPILVLVVLAAHYFAPAVKKIVISPAYYDWAFEFDLSLLFAWAHFKGWFSFLSPAAPWMFSVLETLNTPMVLASVLLELAAVGLLVSRRTALVMIVLFTAFQVGLFVLTGTMFWQWALAQLMIGLYVVGWPDTLRKAVFSGTGMVLCVMVLALTPFYPVFNVTYAGWWHTGYLNEIDLVGQGASGRLYPLSPSVFGPYRYFFQYRGPEFTFRNKTLPVRTPSPGLSEAIKQSLRTKQDLRRLKGVYGQTRYDPDLTGQFDEFVRRYFVNAQQVHGWPGPLATLQPPQHLSMNDEQGNLLLNRIDEPLVGIHFVYREGFYRNRTIHPLDEVQIHTVNFSSGSSPEVGGPSPRTNGD